MGGQWAMGGWEVKVTWEVEKANAVSAKVRKPGDRFARSLETQMTFVIHFSSQEMLN